MNLTKIFEMQKELDKSIYETHELDKVAHVKTKALVALLVEVGEFANEYAPFKYWKKSKAIKREAVLEEFVDGIHFLTSIANELNLDPEVKVIIANEDKSLQLAETFKAINILLSEYNVLNLAKAYGLYLGNAVLLKITEKEILNHYIAKNKINYERLKNNY